MVIVRAIIKIGNSAGVLIPKELLEELGIKIGDEVRVCIARDKKSIIVKLIGK